MNNNCANIKEEAKQLRININKYLRKYSDFLTELQSLSQFLEIEHNLEENINPDTLDFFKRFNKYVTELLEESNIFDGIIFEKILCKYPIKPNLGLHFQKESKNNGCVIISTFEEKKEFFIYDLTQYKTIKSFLYSMYQYSSIGLQKRLTKIPIFGEVFGVKYFNQICRAVRSLVAKEKTFYCFLLDYAVEFEVDYENTEFFDIPEDLKSHPSLAIRCKLDKINLNLNTITKENFFEYKFDKFMKFNFIACFYKAGIWYLELEPYYQFPRYLNQVQQNDLQLRNAEYHKMQNINRQKKQKKLLAYSNKSITKSDRKTNSEHFGNDKKILSEISVDYSNAVIVPICELNQYDCNDECFDYSEYKYSDGNMLQSECIGDLKYIARQEIGLPAMCAVNSKVEIVVTAIKDCLKFYGQIIKQNNSDLRAIQFLTQKWNSRNEFEKFKKFEESLPIVYELVFAKYNDGLFYRAKVIEIINPKYVFVFYLDHGNSSVVPLSQIRKWDKAFDVIQFQAHLFTFHGVDVAEQKENELLTYMNNQILGRKFIAQIIDMNVILSVKLFTNFGKDLIEEMVAEKLLYKLGSSFEVNPDLDMNEMM